MIMRYKPMFIVFLLRLVSIIVDMSPSKISVGEMSSSLTILVEYMIGHHLDAFESVKDCENKVLFIGSTRGNSVYKGLSYEVHGNHVYMENHFISELTDDIVQVFVINYLAHRGYTLDGNAITRSDRSKTCKIPSKINSTENLALLKTYISNYVVKDVSVLVDYAKILMDAYDVNTVDVTDSRGDSALDSVRKSTNFDYGYSHQHSARSKYSLFCPLITGKHEIARIIHQELRDIHRGEYRFSQTKISTDDSKGLIVKISRQ